MFVDWKMWYRYHDSTSQIDLQIPCNPYRNFNCFKEKIRNRPVDLKMHMEKQRIPTSQNSFEKEPQIWRPLTSWFQMCVQVTKHDAGVRTDIETKEPRKKPRRSWLTFSEGAPNTWCQDNWISTCDEWIGHPCLIHVQKWT